VAEERERGGRGRGERHFFVQPLNFVVGHFFFSETQKKEPRMNARVGGNRIKGKGYFPSARGTERGSICENNFLGNFAGHATVTAHQQA